MLQLCVAPQDTLVFSLIAFPYLIHMWRRQKKSQARCVDTSHFYSLLLCFDDPRIRKIRNEVSSPPEVFHGTLCVYYVASSPGVLNLQMYLDSCRIECSPTSSSPRPATICHEWVSLGKYLTIIRNVVSGWILISDLCVTVSVDIYYKKKLPFAKFKIEFSPESRVQITLRK